MKSKWIIAMGVVAVTGMLVSHVGAALLTMQVELAPGQTGRVTKEEPNAVLHLYAYIAGSNGVYGAPNPTLPDDGVSQLMGGIKSSTGGLQADTFFSLKDPNFTVGTSSQLGTGQNLDGDLDQDWGGTAGNTATGWVVAFVAGNGYQGSMDSNKTLIGTMNVIAFSDSTMDANTAVRWMWRPKTLVPKNVANFRVDGTNYALNYDNANIAPGPGVNLIFVPEPVTIALLLAGGSALVLRRRRKA